MFFWKQSHLYARNGDTARVRFATILVCITLAVMFGNLIWVNMVSAMRGGYASPIVGAKYIALVSSWLFAGALWHLWNIFRKIQH